MRKHLGFGVVLAAVSLTGDVWERRTGRPRGAGAATNANDAVQPSTRPSRARRRRPARPAARGDRDRRRATPRPPAPRGTWPTRSVRPGPTGESQHAGHGQRTYPGTATATPGYTNRPGRQRQAPGTTGNVANQANRWYDHDLFVELLRPGRPARDLSRDRHGRDAGLHRSRDAGHGRATTRSTRWAPRWRRATITPAPRDALCHVQHARLCHAGDTIARTTQSYVRPAAGPLRPPQSRRLPGESLRLHHLWDDPVRLHHRRDHDVLHDARNLYLRHHDVHDARHAIPTAPIRIERRGSSGRRDAPSTRGPRRARGRSRPGRPISDRSDAPRRPR